MKCARRFEKWRLLLFYYFILLFLSTQALRQINLKVKMARSGSLFLGSRICPNRSRFTLFFYSFFFAFFLLFAFCFLLFFLRINWIRFK